MTEKVDKIVRIGNLTCICHGVPVNWTDKELHRFAWNRIVKMKIEEAKGEIMKERFRHAE